MLIKGFNINLIFFFNEWIISTFLYEITHCDSLLWSKSDQYYKNKILLKKVSE